MDSMNDKELIERLRALRKAAHMTQQQVADYVPVQRATVSNWERGINVPDGYTIRRLRKLFAGQIERVSSGVYSAPDISTLRYGASLSQPELADLMDVPEYLVSQWENGHAEPTDQQYGQLSELFNVKLRPAGAVELPPAPVLFSELPALRAKAGYSQRELAEALGVSERTVAYWEQLYKFPRPTARAELAELLGVAGFIDNREAARVDAPPVDRHGPYVSLNMDGLNESERAPELKQGATPLLGGGYGAAYGRAAGTNAVTPADTEPAPLDGLEIMLTRAERQALARAGRHEVRTTAGQAVYVIRCWLIERGYLTKEQANR